MMGAPWNDSARVGGFRVELEGESANSACKSHVMERNRVVDRLFDSENDVGVDVVTYKSYI